MKVNMLLVGNQKGYIPVILFHCILLSCVKTLCYKIGTQFNRSALAIETGADSGLVKLVVMTNVFFNNQQYKIKIKRFLCVK